MANRTFFNDWEGDDSSMNVTPSHDNNNDVTFNDQNAIGAAQMPIQNIPLPPDHHGLAPGASGPTWVHAQQFYAKKSQPQPPPQSQGVSTNRKFTWVLLFALSSLAQLRIFLILHTN